MVVVQKCIGCYLCLINVSANFSDCISYEWVHTIPTTNGNNCDGS